MPPLTLRLTPPDAGLEHVAATVVPDTSIDAKQEQVGIPLRVVISWLLPALSITRKGTEPGGVAVGVDAKVVYMVDVTPLQMGGKHWPKKQLLQSVTTDGDCHW